MFGRLALDALDELGIIDHGEGAEMLHGRRRVLESLAARGVHEGEDGAGVIEEVVDLVLLQVRVHHHDDGPDLQDAEQGVDELRPVLERDDDPLLGLHPHVAKQVGEAIGRVLDLGVADATAVAEQGSSISPALRHSGVQEVVCDVEPCRRMKRHGARCYAAARMRVNLSRCGG